MRSFNFSAVFLLSMLFFSCRDNNVKVPTTAPASPAVNNVGPNPNVYIAGVSVLPGSSFGSTGGIVWRNGIADTLNEYSASIQSIFVNGTDVYAAGYVGNWIPIHNGFLYKSIATYWKNGIPVYLSDSTKYNAYVESIVVANNSVYAVGYRAPWSAMAWKDGTEVNLSTPGLSQSVAVSAFVSGTDFYVAGWIIFPNNSVIATYWKNGSPVYLTDGTNPSNAMSIFVSGDDVYVAGNEGDQLVPDNVSLPLFSTPPTPKYGKAVCWKNGQPFVLSTQGYASSIFVNGTDVYVCGSIVSFNTTNQFNLATYWKNGVQVTVGSQNGDSWANAIAVTQNGDVYLAGRMAYQAAYWVNGQNAMITTTNENSDLYSIFLTN